ncbi:hypothetical protein H2199_000264 [Coniosporium tulheliwenetii]|uniref:Uncharacterized protein n=1 Tax=Coniosporium tulheliwenetii TaxID=3383036 RepID=A0ACC2ZPU9_9PEZI|nr:hypothetical protein H2199_000264 [Cladosporium sp. JES 115]
MPALHCTRFPNLYTSSSPVVHGDGLTEAHIGGLRLPEEIIHISWAALLRSYTSDEEVVFLTDDCAVRVDARSWVVERISGERESASPEAVVTGVFRKENSISEQLALSLLFDPETGQGRLRASRYVPEDHLRELAEQLKHAVRWTLCMEGMSESTAVNAKPSLSVLNRNPELLDGPRLLHELLDLRSSQTCAIDFLRKDGNRTTMSYSELYSTATAWATRLQQSLAKKVSRRQQVIPVLIPQSPELYIALIAILKAGAAFCPVNLDAPEKRVKFILNDVSAGIVLTTSEFNARIPNDDALEIVCIDEEPSAVAADPTGSSSQPQPEDLAYIMYTSGSTGTPKGVGLSHFAVTQSLLAHDRHIPVFSRFLQFAAPTFDVSMFEIFFPLFRGRTLVGCDRNRLLDDLPNVINELNVDAAELTPTVAATLLRSRDSTPGLKLLLTIGEMLTTPVTNEFGSKEEHRSILWGMYGPTEAAIHCTLQPDFQASSKVGLIGKPLDTVSTFIVAPSTPESRNRTDVEVLPVGHIGELALGGHQLANGYLNRSEETAAAFIETKEYGRLYRTGDKARMLPDGTIECLGRIATGQVKLRGQRIELGEVEQAVARVPGCRSVAASVVASILVIFCLADDGGTSKQEVLDMCRRWLPAFMVPGDVVLLSELPRLPSGKVDRKRLESDYERCKEDAVQDASAYSDSFEQRICEIIQEVLHRRTTPSTVLSTTGLDSLSAIRAASSLRKAGFSLTAVDILAAKDVKALRNTIDKKESPESNGEYETPKTDIFEELQAVILNGPDMMSCQSQVYDVLRCTPLQASMLAESAVRSQAYCNWVELEFPAGSTAEAIKYWISALAAKHSSLRSGFVTVAASNHSHAQIVWTGLDDEQISEVTEFNYAYEVHSSEALLRPLKIQVNCTNDRPRALLQLHHALYDGWSIDLILKDLDSLVAGKSLSEGPQFRPVAEFYASVKDAADWELAKGYWAKHLADFSPAAFPNLHGRLHEDDSLTSVTYKLAIPWGDVKSLANQLSINPQVFFQAAFAYLLSHYFGSSDVVHGTITSGRTIPVTGIEDIVGPCICTLPLRVDISRSRTVKDLLLSIQRLNRELLRHCILPLLDIKQACSVRPGTALFDTLLIWQESLESHSSESRSVRQINSADQLEFKLIMELEPRVDHVTAKAAYQKSIIPHAHMQLLFEQLDQLVTHFVRNVECSINDLGNIFAMHTLSVANPYFERQDTSQGLAHSVEVRARTSPDDLAVVFAESISEKSIQVQTITYQELNLRSNKLAHFLKAQGVHPDDLVCICMEKSLELYIAILATIKAGAGYLPVTPETPQERIRYILQEAGVKLCLTQMGASSNLAKDAECDITFVDQLDLDTYPEHNLCQPYRGSNLAYAVFTSGSTGTPKGVLVTQDNLVSNLKVLSEIYPVPEGSRLLQSCSQAFDVSVFEIFFAWHSGMCLCSATKDVLFHDLENAIRQMNISHLSLTPTVAALVHPLNVPKVKFLVTAGEAVTEHRGNCPTDLINNIGGPFKNTSVFIFEEGGTKLVPKGGIGELCFGGDQVFRGYLNAPELTASKIINHPEFGRLYRSGDLGRLLTDDSILFAGRSDDQVKIRGQRVELGEINSCILDDKAVRDCVSLIIRDNKSKAQQLVTFWIPSSSSSQGHLVLPAEAALTVTITRVYETLSSKLPVYMIPKALVPVTFIPMTVQGKVDRRKIEASYESLSLDYLNAVSQASSEGGDEDRAHWTEAESRIAEALAKVLGLAADEVKRHSSFFSLGLDSISAIAFSRALKDIGFPTIAVSAILKNPSIARLGRQMSEERSSKPAPEIDLDKVFTDETLLRIQKIVRDHGNKPRKILPCTPLQEAMLSAGASSATSTYCNKMTFEITGELDRLKDCWVSMCRRHDILRTCFVPTEEPQFPFAQVVLEDTYPPWDATESETVNIPKDFDDRSGRIISSLIESYQPPLHFTTAVSGGSKYLLFACHHSLYDGAAIAELLHEVEQTYQGKSLPPAVPYEPYLGQMLATRNDATDEFWKEKLRAFEPSAFPDLTGRSYNSRTRLTKRLVHSETLPMSLSALEAHCRQLSVSLLSLGHAALTKVLALYLDETDLCFGNVYSGRTLPVDGLERLVAPCFNTLPVRVTVSTQMQNIELMRALQDMNADVLPFQLTPLRRIQSQFGSEGTHLFDTLFLLQQPSEGLNDQIWQLREDVGEMDLPLVCELTPNVRDDTLVLALHFQEFIMFAEDARNVAQAFLSALDSCIQYPHAPTTDLAYLPSRLLSISKPHPTRYDPKDGPLLHSAFEKNASIRPSSAALVFQHVDGTRTQCTFEELNQKSNRIAHALLEADVGLEDAVPICIPKGPLFYASVLGVLKAGAAFTPFDPDLPVQRKRYMLEELNAKTVLRSDGIDVSWVGDVRTVDVSHTYSYPTSNPVVPGLKDSNLAYRLYTSGSTGKPKAVSVEHRNPVQTVESSRSIIPWNHDTRLLQFAATTFDMCYYDCFLAWSFGFSLCAAEQRTMLDDTPAIINSLAVTHLDLTPSVASSISRESVPTVEYLYCIGEAMPQSLVDEWAGRCVNSYGPTEAAFCCTIFPADSEVKSAVIGKPFPTTSFTVLSSNGDRVLPVGASGELHIGGYQVARGYHANEKLTGSRFIRRDGQRLYKTGDLVRMLSNGTFEFIGRSDDQVKIRGLRVELGEITQVIRNSDDRVQDASTQVLRLPDSSKDQLVAFLALGSNKDVFDHDGIKHAARSAASASLPSYMVPAFFLTLERIPLSAAGKVDKKRLRALFEEHAADMSDADEDGTLDTNEDWTTPESQIRSVFAKLARTPIERVKRGTTIYQLGLDSISAVQVASQLRHQGLQVSASNILEHPTCADLASSLTKLHRSQSPQQRHFDFEAFANQFLPAVCKDVGMPVEAIETLLPCTPLQTGLIAPYVRSQGKMYFNYLRFGIDPKVTCSALRNAWESVCSKHPMLRTGFVHVNHPQYPFAMAIHKYSADTVPLTIVEDKSMSDKDIEAWRQTAATDASQSLHCPQWRAIVVAADDGLAMHVCMLHAIYDAQSLRIILDDFAAACNGEPLKPARPIEPVLDAILTGSDGDNDADHEFWKKQGHQMPISRFPNMTPLRVCNRNSQVLVKAYSRTIVELEQGCREANITIQAAGQAAWARLLSAYIGEPAVTFGVVLSGRTIQGAQLVAFPCITTVPLACKPTDSNRLLLDHMMQFNSAVQRHQFTPLTRIQRLAGHGDGTLFDTLFAYQKLQHHHKFDMPWEIEDEEATADYTISVELEPLPDRHLQFRITYLPDVIPKEQVEKLLDQLDALLTDLVVSPDASFDEFLRSNPALTSVTPAKSPQLTSDVKLLHEFVEQGARVNPQKIAFEFATSLDNGRVISRCWTYAQLDAEGNKIAHLLLKRGAKPGDLVAMCFDKCPQASFAMLGILKAGCAFVALDHGAPITRKSFIVEDSTASMVLSMREQSGHISQEIKVPIINLDDDYTAENLSDRAPDLSRNINSWDRSYCLYTSGTTGTPKGCELTHENAVQAMLAFTRMFDGHWDEESRWLQFASFHFDVCVLEQFWSWSVGIRVVSAPRDLVFEDLAGSIRTLSITHIDLTPSLARVLHPDDVPSLCKGVFITGGEQLKQEILDTWGPKRVIYNGYGPTEATIGVTMFPRVPENGKPSNIGRQFDNVGSYVLRLKSDVPVLRGAVGELCVSGKLVGKGYLNRADLTHERFPVLESFGERVYRTGDLVRVLHDNTFDFLGRADDQVKLRGQRLEIGEINSVIKQEVDGIQDVVTLVLKHAKQQKEQLVSFVVRELSTGPNVNPRVSTDLQDIETAAAAREACQGRLPRYMVPTHVVPLTTIPLSANNKADANRLRNLYDEITPDELQRLSGLREGDSTSMSEEERKIAGVLGNMAQVNEKDISRSSTIFELGLDSISVLGFSHALKKAGFGNAHASLILRNPTIPRLARAMGSGKSSKVASNGSVTAAKQLIAGYQHHYKSFAAHALGIEQKGIESIAPTTPLQQGIISRSLESEEPAYFGAFYFRLLDRTDLARLQRAWTQAFRSVQTLRTKFIPTEKGHIQVALRKGQLPWIECTVPDNMATEEFLHNRVHKWWRQNRDHFRKPFEVVIVRSPSATIMAVHLFHALYDGTSLPILLQKVQAEYRECQDIDYGPAFQDVLPYGPLRETGSAREFWTNHLSNARPRPMPCLAPHAGDDDTSVVVELQNLDRLETVRRRLNATLQALIQACWAAILQHYFAGDVTFGMVVSGRSIDFEGVEQVIGPLFNTVPFHLRFTAQDTWSSIVRRCHDLNLEALPFQHTALRDIMKWCKRTSDHPFFDTLFVFQKAVEDPVASGIKSLWTPMDSEVQADYPLALEVEQQTESSLKLTLVTQSHVSNQESSMNLLRAFENALQNLLNDPDARVADTVDIDVASSRLEESSVNGHSNGYLNGVEDFEWTSQAIRIRDAIARLAGVDNSEVDEHVSIFDLGLDSIDAIKLSAKFRGLGIHIPVSGIMRGPTIPRMLKQISQGCSADPDRKKNIELSKMEEDLRRFFQRTGRDLTGIEQVRSVTPLQEAMVAEMVNSEFNRYYNHDVLKLSRGVDIERLKTAWKTVMDRTPILRTTFAEVGDPDIHSAFAQLVHIEMPLKWREVEVLGTDDISGVLEQHRKIAKASECEDNLIQLTLVRSRADTYLAFSIAHALYDGWSLGLLHDDVRRAYGGHTTSRPPFDAILEDLLGASSPSSGDFWREFLSNAARTRFPRRSHTVQQPEVHRQEQTSSTSMETLNAFCKSQSITLQALGQTCWALLLGSRVRNLDVTFGVVLAGRDSEDAMQTLFPTMNTVAVRSILHGTRREMLQYVQENINGVREHQHFPLRKVQAIAGSQGQALFDTLFIYQKRPEATAEAEEPLYESVGGASNVEYPVCVEMETVSDQLIWRTACSAEVLDDTGTGELLKQLDSVLSCLIVSPEDPLLDFADKVSICGLPPFTMESDTNGTTEDSASTTNGTPDHAVSWSPTECAIREVLAAVSGVPEGDISKDMTMFHMGLDSISAIKVSSLLRRKSIKLSVSAMLRAATVEKMAAVVDGQQRERIDSGQSTEEILSQALASVDQERLLHCAGIAQDNVEQFLPATAGQVYMLATWQNSEGTLFYPAFKYRLNGASELSTLRQAWVRLVHANQILRTVLVATENRDLPFVQVILKAAEESFIAVKPDSEPKVTETSASKQPFVNLYARKEADGWKLTLKIHHALYDGVSLPNLMRQLETLCSSNQGPIPGPNAFADFIALSASEKSRHRRQSFWTNYLSGTSKRRLAQPIAQKGPRVELFRSGVLPDAKPLETLARQHGLSIQSLFLAAYARIYATLVSRGGHEANEEGDTDDVVFGIYLANRSHPVEGLAELAAPTVNLVPLRVREPLRATLLESAARVQADLQEVGGAEVSAVGLWEIERWTGVRIDSFVNFLKLPDADEAEGEADEGRVRIEEVGAKRAVEFARVAEPGDGLSVEPEELKKNTVADVYLHSLDIEATVRHGALDVGVFAPVEMLDLEHAEELVQDLARLLKDVL